MHIILTHEQADFDALASLLGAALVQNDAIPVLPKTLNRNVQSFINLYADDLPFCEVDDLPDTPIHTITLVDTQSLVTLKGQNKSTKVFVIDHHKRKVDLPNQWTFTEVDTGACTTFFVEQLQEHNGAISMIQATMLLLGIYEDTGSLTYANTTTRDVLAVAHLIEMGASLKIASGFLNPPLSEAQRVVFDQLLENMESVHVKNCRVIISIAEAPELVDEVSSIAHKLCDLLDPDALFIFVKTREGIRLVARSISDQVNVAEIAAAFNGGGHDRAAAALIKHNRDNPDQLNDIKRIFLQELPSYIQPAVSVSQIMSKKPLTISPDTTAREALELMHQFGYEGYPVVENGKVKGLLNRRSVDRALAHKMNLTASSLMEVGDFSVTPDDSLDTLQKIMAESGWGQIPVIDPASKDVIGITTRTDLLKTLAGRVTRLSKMINLSKEMQHLLPKERFNLIQLISRSADNLRMPVYIVGGFVRDILLKEPCLDMDFVVEGDAIALADWICNHYGGSVTSHKQFGTAKWCISPSSLAAPLELNKLPNGKYDLPDTIDLISARTEFYERPTALPTIKKSSIKLDLLRRDFTINTMAIRLDGAHFGNLYDYWGGYQDLKKKKIRVLHSLSFVDDPTRMLRAVRFEQRFGFSIEERTLHLMNEARSLIEQVSGDRIRHEIELILEEERVLDMLNRLDELELFKSLHPSIVWDGQQKEALLELKAIASYGKWLNEISFSTGNQFKLAAYTLLFVRLEKTDLNSVVSRLRLNSRMRRTLVDVNEIWLIQKSINAMPPSEITFLLEKIPPPTLMGIWLLSKNRQFKSIIEEYIKNWRKIEPSINGNKLKAMGLEPGPTYKEIIQKIRIAWIDGDIHSKDEEKSLLAKLVKDQQSN